ncbi:hypothetical protein CHS0354_026820 [Potamilus streckersoni]|uniref:Uncharacterized protein n=1 Tax=Potamilus streckersoni TaxID=2493646 RepID=A0AAE0W7K1_9BIVA|nr:hypothetical protein CHS0354_026820 [Potamilus streckersoni]
MNIQILPVAGQCSGSQPPFVRYTEVKSSGLKYYTLKYSVVFCVLVLLWGATPPVLYSQDDPAKKRRQFCRPARSSKTEHLFLPFFLRFQGVGNFIGAGYIGKNALFDTADVFFAQNVIDNPVSIAGIRNYTIPLFYSSVYAAGFYARSLQLPYAFSRGMDKESFYYVRSDLQGALIGISMSLTEDRVFSANFGFAFVDEKVTGVKNQEYQLLFSPKRAVSLLSSDIYYTQLKLDFTDSQFRPTAGIVTGFNYYSVYPKQLYSAFGSLELYLNFYIPFGNFVFSGHFLTSGTSVIDRREGGSDALVNELSEDCINQTGSNFSETEKADLCGLFARRFSDYLTGFNQKGTSAPLGGPNRLRSDMFYRYQGSRTNYQSLELRYVGFDLFNVPVEVALFADRGSTYDAGTAGQDKSERTATGIGIRGIGGDAIYRLDTAVGNDSAVGVNLTLDYPY